MVCLVGVWYAKEKKNIMREYVRFPGTERYLGIDWGGLGRRREEPLADDLGELRAADDLSDDLGFPALRHSSNIARAAHAEVLLCNGKSICCLAEDIQSLRPFIGTQETVALGIPSSYPSPELVQSSKPEPVCGHNDNDGCVGDIDSDFHDGCRKKDVQFPSLKLGNSLQDGLLFHIPGNNSCFYLIGLLGEIVGHGRGSSCDRHNILKPG